MKEIQVKNNKSDTKDHSTKKNKKRETQEIKIEDSKPIKNEKNVDKKSKKIKKEPEASKGQKELDPKALKKAAKNERLRKAKDKLKVDKVPIKKNIDFIASYPEFVKTETLKYKKIRERTIKKIIIDKELVKKAVKGLIKHHENTKNKFNLLDSGDEFIYLEIIMSQVPTEYSIRPIQM